MSPEALLKEAAAKGVQKLVLTDINNTSAIIDFHRHAKNYPVTPVAGIDFRNGMQQHFVGIAKNHTGFHELNQFLSKCLQEAEPGLTGREAIIPARAPALENAFVIYPFASLQIAQPRRDGGDLSASRLPLKENEFIGIKPGDLTRLPFSPWKNQPDRLVILAPVTFRNKSDFNIHRLLRAIDNNTLLSKLPLNEQAAPDEIMVPEEELKKIFSSWPVIIRNTEELLLKCDVIDFQFEQYKNKKFFTGSEKSDEELLLNECEETMQYRYPNANEKIRERFKKEIDLIKEKQFTSYFLINWDIVKHARLRNFFYVGRGSGANSIVAYLLKITDVDPIDLDLYFERFINPSRINPPDFDIDFSWKDRDEIIKYIFKKYGENHTALLGTYSTFQANAVVRELGKVFGLPKAQIDGLLDPQEFPETDDDIIRLIYQYSRGIHDFPNHLSIHAGGILISDKPITYYTALSNPPKGFPLAQFSMLEAEDVGFAKFDILSQRGLGHIKEAVEIIKKNRNEEIDIHDVKRFKEDKKVEWHLTNAKLIGCFYVESPAMRGLLAKLCAKTYLDLVAASSIIRPGVARSGMMREYIRRFHDPLHGQKESIPELWKIMPDTFGVMVYQEDVIKVAHYFAKLTLGEADMLRRGMSGKYRGRAEFQKIRQTFFTNCKKENYPDALTNEVWREIESFGGYAFAKGHSASFAVESYQSMFLKAYYPIEFMVGVINNFGGFYRTEYYVHEARMSGAAIHAPDINKSDCVTTVYGKDIFLGFTHMAELEEKTVEAILKERKTYGGFKDLVDFMNRVSIAAEQLRLLIRVGAFSFTGRTKKQLLWDIYTVIGSKKRSTARKELFDNGYKNFLLPELYNDPFEDARDEIEILGFPLCPPFTLIKQPLQSELVAARLKINHGRAVEIMGYYVTYKPTTTIKGEVMMFGTFLDKDGFFFDTTHFPDITKRFPFRGKGCYWIKGKVVEDFGFYSIDVVEMQKLDYVMYENDAESIARSKPDPIAMPVVVPSSKQYEYLLVIAPPPHIRQEIESLKKRFHRQFDHYQAIASKPDIILCNFLQSETMEPEMVRAIAKVSERCEPFHLKLDGFDHFKPHTIFNKIVNPEEVSEVSKKLKQELKLAVKNHFHPHLAIAKGLDKEKFSRATSEFYLIDYTAHFLVNSIVLLRRESGLSKCDMVREFKFASRAPGPTFHQVINIQKQLT